MSPTDASTLQQAQEAARYQLQQRLPPTLPPGRPAPTDYHAQPEACHSRTERQQLRWIFRSAQAHARKKSSNRKAAKKARRRSREAYLFFNPDDKTSEGEQDDQAASANGGATAAEGSILYVPTSPE